MKKLLVIGTDRLRNKYRELTKPRFERYASENGFDFVSCEESPVGFSRSPLWIKIPKIIELLESCESLLYIDCDVSIIDFSKVPETKKDIGFCRDSSLVINTGVLAVNSTEFAKKFLKDVWERGNPSGHPREDNLAFIQEYDNLSSEDKKTHFETLDHFFNVTIVRGEFPFLDTYLKQDADKIYFRHFAGKQPWNSKYFKG